MTLKLFSSFVLIIICLTLFNPGCKKEESTAPTNMIPADLVATWTATAVLVNGSSVSLANALGWQSGTVQATIVFTASGELTYTEFSSTSVPLQVNTGTIAVSGSTATLKYLTDNGQPANPPEEIVATWGVTGNQLSLTWTVTQVGTIALSLTK